MTVTDMNRCQIASETYRPGKCRYIHRQVQQARAALRRLEARYHTAPMSSGAALLPRPNHHEWAMVYVGQLEGFLSRITCNASEGTHCTKSQIHKPTVNEIK